MGHTHFHVGGQNWNGSPYYDVVAVPDMKIFIEEKMSAVQIHVNLNRLFIFL